MKKILPPFTNLIAELRSVFQIIKPKRFKFREKCWEVYEKVL